MQRRKKMKNKKVISVVALVVLIVALAGIYLATSKKPEAQSGSKAITIEVVDSEGETTAYEVKTDAEYLSQAMEEAEGLEFEGEDGDYGLVIYTVNGEYADYNTNGAYWSLMVNGEYGNYGADSQPVADGDTFQIVYTPAE